MGAISGEIQLYAVSTRYPSKLFSGVSAEEIREGVWECRVLSRNIRILVLSRLPLEQRNAILAFFTFDRGKVKFALENYQWQMDDGSTVINQLLERYTQEGIDMPYTMEQFRKEYVKAHLGDLDPEEVLSRFSLEDRLKDSGLKTGSRDSGLKTDSRDSGLRTGSRDSGLRTDSRVSGLKTDSRDSGLRGGGLPEETQRKKGSLR